MSKYISEFNEFTWDMVRTLPKAYYYHVNNIPYKLEHKLGLSSVYSFVKHKKEINTFNDINDTTTYNFLPPPFTKKEWSPPPLKEWYKDKIKSEKPTVVIQNKYSLEWGEGVFNYFSLEFLKELFNYLTPNYTIIYIRPESNLKDYYHDENKILEFLDYEMIKTQYPQINTIKDFLLQYPNLDYNTLQFMIEASSQHHIGTSGGNACVASYFEGDVMIFDAPEGQGKGRGIWKTDSWLKNLSGASIFGFNDYESLLNKVKERW